MPKEPSMFLGSYGYYNALTSKKNGQPPLENWTLIVFSKIFRLLCLVVKWTSDLVSSRGEYSVRVPSGPSRLSFFKIWPFSAEFHITYMYDIFIYLAKIMLLRENLFMAEFFNSHQKLCQGTNDKKLIHIHNLYTPKLKRKPKDCFRSVTLGTLT